MLDPLPSSGMFRRPIVNLDWDDDVPPKTNGTSPHPVLRPPSAFLLPPDNHSSTLLGNRYLCRGDGMVLSGTSGIGKSSLALLLAVLWGLGRPAFGIQPNGPLKSLIIQSEDSDGDVAEVWASIRHALAIPDGTDPNVRIVTDRVNRGLPFNKVLREHIASYSPDLVWINPLQAFMDGDITDARDLGNFLRGGLNGLNEPPRLAFVLVHHTTKPATGKERHERLWHEVMYDMAGGAELINWARAIMSLRPAETQGDFNLVLAKRGLRAGVTRPSESGNTAEPTTVIPLRHAKGSVELHGRERPMPLIFWEGRDPDAPKPQGKSTGRTPTHEFSAYRNIFPPSSGPGLDLAKLHNLLATNLPIPKKSLYSALKRWAEDGFVEVLEAKGTPVRYRASRLISDC